MMSMPQTDNATHLCVLLQDLRDLRRASDRLGAGDLVHSLYNAIQTAHTALSVVETRLGQGRTDEVERLLFLADQRLRGGRRLIAQRQWLREGKEPALARPA
jgi:hypothetical protein